MRRGCPAALWHAMCGGVLVPDRVFVLVFTLCCALAAQGDLRSTWAEVTTAQSRGGRVVACSFNADARHMLTAGELGDLILWDLPNRRELRRWACHGAPVRIVRMHPREPWALVVSGRGEETAVHVVMLGNERSVLLHHGDVEDIAFDHDGARVAMLTSDGNLQSELWMLRAAGVLGGFADEIMARRKVEAGKELLFTPDETAIIVTSYYGNDHHRVPLDGGEARRGSGRVVGFNDQGAAVIADSLLRRPGQCNGRWSAVYDEQSLRLSGPTPREWPLPKPWRQLHGLWVAPDGTLALADDVASLYVFGPGAEQAAEMTGHLAPPLQLVFAEDGSAVAVVQRQCVKIVDCSDGSSTILPGASLARPAGDARFYLLRADKLAVYDSATHELLAPRMSWNDAEARLQYTSWYRDFDPTAFHISAPTRFHPAMLWLGASLVDGGNEYDRAIVRYDDPDRASLAPDRSVRDNRAYTHMHVSALDPLGEGGSVLMAETTKGLQCGTGLEHIRYWSALRRFDGRGGLRRVRYLERTVRRVRVAPNDRFAMLLPAGELVATRTLRTVSNADCDPAWIDFAFVSKLRGVATDGQRLYDVKLPSLRAKPLMVPLGSGEIDALATSNDGALLAVSVSGVVHLLRRAESRRRGLFR